MSRHTLLFLTALFSNYSAEGLDLEMRPLHPVWRESELYPGGNAPANWQSFTLYGIRQWYPLTAQGIEAAAKHALAIARRYEVYFGVLPRHKRGGKRNDVPFANVLWCDVDGGNGTPQDCLALVLSHVRAGRLPAPDVIVGSGGGCHCYWRLKEPVPFHSDADRREFKELLKRLVETIGGEVPGVHADSSRADIASVLRVPGTLNNKIQGKPRPVELLHLDASPDPLSYTEWLELLPAPAKPAQREYSPFRADVPESYSGLLRWASEGYSEGKRHQDLTGAAAWLVRDVGVPKSVALELLKMKAQNSLGQRIITFDELEAILQWT